MSERVDPYAAYRATLAAEGACLREAWTRLTGGDPGARDDLARLLHRLHGTSGTYGFDEVSSRARQLRQRLVTEPPASFDPGALEPLLAALREEAGRGAPSTVAPVLDLERAREACAGDEGLRRDVAAELLRSLPGDGALLRSALREADGTGVGRAAHRLKSSLAAAGALEASGAAGALDQAARVGDARVPELATAFLEALDRAVAAIERSLRDP
jgi:HPt (histidine-containing phosphotransfer) domain-containing protein